MTASARTAPRWSPDALFRLEALVDQGLTSGQIARQLGTTRNAVVSKCRVLGLKLKARRGGVPGQARNGARPALCDPWSAWGTKRWEERNA
jgi:hypothetical protein